MKWIFLLLLLSLFVWSEPANAVITTNGTVIGTNDSIIEVTNELTFDFIENNGLGFSTRNVPADESRTYTFDRTDSSTSYDVSWTEITSARLDFTITSVISDARLLVTSTQIGQVIADGKQQLINFNQSLNTVLLGDFDIIEIIFEFLSTGSVGSSLPPIDDPIDKPDELTLFDVESISLEFLLGQAVFQEELLVEWDGSDDLVITGVELADSPFTFVFPDEDIFLLADDSKPINAQPIYYGVETPTVLCIQKQTDDCVYLTLYTIPITVTAEVKGKQVQESTVISIDLSPKLPDIIPFHPIWIIGGILLLSLVLIVGKLAGGKKKKKKKGTKTKVPLQRTRPQEKKGYTRRQLKR